MADSVQPPTIAEAQSAFSADLEAARERGTALVARANEVMVNTARAVWESEMELLRLQSEQVTRTLTPVRPGDDPAAAVAASCEQWREGSEKLLNHMRTVSDLVRKGGWDLFQIYQESVREAAKPFQVRSR